VVIGNDCTGSWKLNYHTIMTMTVPVMIGNETNDKKKKNYIVNLSKSTLTMNI
jgi:hypothetical protein